MPYKNSAGNSGIAAEYANWRYFNANLQRLGEYRSPRLSGEAPKVTADPVTNWMNAAGNVFQGAMGLFEARREYSYKLADDWLSKHSLEEYHQLMKDNNIPFQDDPIAMQRLKYRHGKILSEIAEVEFQSRIDKGEFVGLEPEEVDAKHFEFLYNNLKEDSDVFPYMSSDDFFFNQGYWEDSNVNRDKVFQKSQVVSDDYTKQLAKIDTESRLTALISSGADSKAILGALKQSYEAYGYHFTPDEYANISKNTFDYLSNTPNGHTIIDELKDTEVPGLKGRTFKSILGGDKGIELLKTTSQNLQYNSDLALRVADDTEIARLVAKGDTGALTRKATEIRQVDGTESIRFKLWWNAIGEAETQRLKLAKEQAKNNKTAWDGNSTLLMASEYNKTILKGEMNDPSKFASNDNKEYWNYKSYQLGYSPDVTLSPKVLKADVNNGLMSKKYTIKDVAEGARQTYALGETFNPFTSYRDDKVRDVTRYYSGLLNNIVDGKPIDLSQEPEAMKIVRGLYQYDPSSLGDISKDDASFLQTIFWGEETGLYTPEQALRARAYEVIHGKDKDFKEQEKEFSKEADRLFSGAQGTKLDTKLAKNPKVMSAYKVAAINFRMNGLKWNDALSRAKELMLENHFKIGGALVDKSFFANPYLSAKYNYEIANDVSKAFSSYLESKHIDPAAVDIYVNPYDGTLGMFDGGNGQEYMKFTREDINKIAKSKQDEVAIKMKLEDIQRGNSGKGFMVDLNVDGKRGND